MELLAKSIKNGGTTLVEHSINTANIASYLCDFLNTKETIKNITIITALLHDIGKCVKPFQDYISSLDEEVEDVEGIVAEESAIINYPHNIIGYAFLSMIDLDFVDMYDIDKDKDFISNSIIFHHLIDGKYKGKTLEVIDSLSEDDINTMYDFIENIVKIADSKFSINLVYNKVNGKRHIDIPNGQYSFNNRNYIYMFIKSILVSADRLASKYEKEGIEITKESISNRYYTDCTYNDINPSFEDLDVERFNNQKDTINRIHTHNTTVLTAPAGYGKTILGLLWNNKLANNKKLYWVTPTNSIARNVYKTLIEELKTFGFDTNMSVGLLIASNYEEGDEDSNIIVTNIDNWLHPTYKNSKGIGYFDLLYNNLVFDEFHNLVSSDAYYSAFIMLMKTRNELCKNSYSLLLSATPITPLLSRIESCEREVYKEPTCQSQNYKQQYHFKLHTSLDDIDLTNLDNSLVVFNSIRKSQSVFRSLNGWMITKDNSSAFTRNSSCTMDSFVQSNDAVPSLETCITDDVVKQSLISYRLQESVGDIEYIMKYGSINLDNLQFVNLTEEDLASQIPSDILEEALSCINGSSYNYKLKYYKKESSTFKDILSNKGFVLTDEHILTIVRDYFKRLFQLVIDKSSAHFEITELEYKLITNPFDEKNEDGWVKINSLEDIDNIEFEPRRFYTEISDEEMEQYRIYNTSLDVCRAEIKAKQKQKQADKAAENKERRERRKREKELAEEEAKTE